ncbi:MAG: hypothetical protein OEZ39_14500 [Gammaproteobacteria bacterium]|nr:hypothetical protein [Gammaproteobacteria bacterium]MDH5653063.1 hypothetical protein [Gammaproteobacteria bacterium]
MAELSKLTGNRAVKVNIIIAKRDRNDSYLTCLHYINNFDHIDQYDVRVYTYEDKADNRDYIISAAGKFSNITLDYKVPYINPDIKKFNKAKLLDMMLREMRQDYDWWSLIDADMIYRPDFLDLIKVHAEQGNAVISLGHHMPQDECDIQDDHRSGNVRSFADLQTCFASKGYSQKSIPKQYYRKLLATLNINSLYDTMGYRFIGYGGEDVYALNILSLYARYVNKDLVMLENMWKHIWHVKETIDQRQWEKNKRNLLPLKREIQRRLASCRA